MRCVVAGGARCGCPKPHLAQGGVFVDHVVFERTSDVQQMACDQHPLKHKVPAFKQMCGAVRFCNERQILSKGLPDGRKAGGRRVVNPTCHGQQHERSVK